MSKSKPVSWGSVSKPGLNLSNPDDPSPGMNLSFAGCGFLGIYHVGVSACLRKYAPDLLVDRIAGASAGALAAACLLCDADLGFITSSVLKCATEARARALGPFSPTFDVETLLREGLLSVLPANAHEILNDRLFVSVTRVSDGKNVILSNFANREELIQALLCSSFIPGFSGYRPLKIRGIRYIDGGFTNNLPELDSATVTVSPFSGEADVCPTDDTAGIITVSLANTSIEISRENLQRFARILFPPPPAELNKMCQQGFNDALDFLQRNNLIACTRCVAVQSTLPVDAENGGRRKENGVRYRENGQRIIENEEDDDDFGTGWRIKKNINRSGGRFLNGDEVGEDAGNIWDSNSDEDYDDEWEDNCADCPDCRLQRQEALLDELPETVVSILQEAIDSANASVTHFAELSATRKLLSLLTMPAAYSISVPIRVAKGILGVLPSAPTWHGLQTFVAQLLELLRTVLLSRRHAAVSDQYASASDTSAPHHRHAREQQQDKQSFWCSVAITEFAGTTDRRGSLAPPTLHDLGDGSSDEGGEHEALYRLGEQYAARSRSTATGPMASLGPSRAASRGPSRVASRAPSRAVSRAVSRRASMADALCAAAAADNAAIVTSAALMLNAVTSQQQGETFERIINETSEQEALMAYYYLDENNQMQVTEIFDMTEAMPNDDQDRLYDTDDDDEEVQQQHHHHHQEQFLTVPTVAPPPGPKSILRNRNSGVSEEQQRYIDLQLSEFRNRRSSDSDSEDDSDSQGSRSLSEPEADQRHQLS